MLLTFGDSISAGYGASNYSNSFPSLISSRENISIVNKATNGSMVPDQAPFVYGCSKTLAEIATLMLGTNDERIYNSNIGKQRFFADGLLALALYIAASPVIAKSFGNYTGAWEQTYAYGIGKNSQIQGSKLSFSVNGAAVYIGYIRQVGNHGSFRVKIDGEDMGLYSCNGDGITTSHGATYGPAALRFANLSDSLHSIEIEVASNGHRVYIDWWSSPNPSLQLKIANIPYALQYRSGGSKENVDSYNLEIKNISDSLKSDGLNVDLVDVNSVLKPIDMFDDYHPNDEGHLKMFKAFSNNQVISFEKIDLYLGSDGVLYIGENKTPIKSII